MPRGPFVWGACKAFLPNLRGMKESHQGRVRNGPTLFLSASLQPEIRPGGPSVLGRPHECILDILFSLSYQRSSHLLKPLDGPILESKGHPRLSPARANVVWNRLHRRYSAHFFVDKGNSERIDSPPRLESHEDDARFSAQLSLTPVLGPLGARGVRQSGNLAKTLKERRV
jgi:hypothetical protein